jgi:hypothetical protein
VISAGYRCSTEMFVESHHLYRTACSGYEGERAVWKKNTDLKRGRADKFMSSKFHNGLKNHARNALKIN